MSGDKKDPSASRTYPVYIKGDPDQVMLTDERVHQIWTNYGFRTKSEAIREIFLAGVVAMSNGSDDARLKIQSLIDDKLRTLQSGAAAFERLRDLQERLSIDDFEEWVVKNDINLTAYKEWLQLQDSQSTKTDKHLQFLRRTLNGKPMAVREIREIAEGSDLIMGDDDWRFMSRIASRYGYSGGSYGVWQKPQD